jgi:hypothetical protein
MAVDLEALGVIVPQHRVWRLIDPRPSYRHLRASWRIGRLRAALPATIADASAEVDGLLWDQPGMPSVPATWAFAVEVMGLEPTTSTLRT